MDDPLIRDFFLGFIKIHILHHAQRGRIYGKEFREELLRHGYDISFGTLYPIFHKLEKQGYLVSKEAVTRGKKRKYYSTTPAGETALEKAKKTTRELFDELNEA